MCAIKVIVRNRKASFDYSIDDRFEAGIGLLGSEVKSLREGKASLADAYVEDHDGELFLVGCHIAPYAYANILNHDPLRPRKLLLHRKEINKIRRKLSEKGYTAIPLSLYFKDGKAKVEIALAKGKRQVDRRHEIRKRDEQRDIEREWKYRR